MENNPPHMVQSETVRFIRTLLMARKQMYTLAEFLKVFEEDGGYDLPAFGYGNPLEFLKSIPDTVQVIPVKNTIYLKVIVSQTAAEMADEFMNNKDGRRRRRRRRGGRRRQNARKETEKKETESEDRPESPNE